VVVAIRIVLQWLLMLHFRSLKIVKVFNVPAVCNLVKSVASTLFLIYVPWNGRNTPFSFLELGVSACLSYSFLDTPFFKVY
jgi:hypothetical protein